MAGSLISVMRHDEEVRKSDIPALSPVGMLEKAPRTASPTACVVR